MLGLYENFPILIHDVARFTYKASTKKIQQAIATSLHDLNIRTSTLEEIAHASPNCEVRFQFGIGDGQTFTFLDRNEQSTLKDAIRREPLKCMDFLCILQYHIVEKSGDRKPLRFDYYLLRFTFGKALMEILVSHERGPRHVNVRDLMDLIAGHLGQKLVDRSFAKPNEESRAIL